jgi:PAS domain S-box-containing protein
VLARQAADLIERTLVEEALREGEERFRLIANSAPVMIWMSGTDNEITYLNQTWLDYAGRHLETTLGHQRIDILHPDEAERCRELYVKAFEQREPFQIEHLLRRHDGEYRKVVTTGVPRYHVDGPFAGYIGTAVDITERKLAEEALSSVSQKLIEAHEEERTRIARELHDDIGQRLAVVSLRLGHLRHSPPVSATDFRREIGETCQQIVDLASGIHAMSHGLHPPKLELIGLEGSVAGLCEELSKRHGVTIDVHFEDIPKALPPETSLCLYRFLQDSMQNVVKHCGSRRAHVSLNGHIYTINLSVKDSGAGFDPHEAMGARVRLDQHEGAIEGRGRAALHPLAARARHDDSGCCASPCPNKARQRRSITCGTRRATH